MTIYSNKLDFVLIKFPIIFPVIYFLFLIIFPSYENYLFFITLLILGETHFGATWPILFNRVNKNYSISNKVTFFFIPFAIAIVSCFLFFYSKNLFFFIFFIFNVYHVTRQSVGICKLYTKSHDQINFQENSLYIFNFIYLILGFFRFYYPIINNEQIYLLLVLSLTLLSLCLIFYIYKYGTKNLSILITGLIIFLPISFVENPIHAVVMGVTMHYSQYLLITYKVARNRAKDKVSYGQKKLYMSNSGFKFVSVVILYSVVMSLLSLSNINNSIEFLILIPILGQLLHFYYDGLLWVFSDTHNRTNTLKHLIAKI